MVGTDLDTDGNAHELPRMERGQDGTIHLSGRLTLARLGRLPEEMATMTDVRRIDLSHVSHVDTVGAWLILRLQKATGASVTGASARTQELFKALETDGDDDTAFRIRPEFDSPFLRFVESVGGAVRTALSELVGILGFLGATLVAFWSVIVSRRKIRWNAIVTRFETVGVNALGIIGLMSVLIGIVVAQQGAVQLQQFGMEMFTINLVGRASIRELGLLMTAIMVAGRSGSAFAAQIGTMKLTEEVDALQTIGVSPLEALVLPRVLAVMIMMPLLGFYAGLCAIFGGGLFCWVGLEIPPLTYIQRLREIIPMTDLWAMLIKAPVFGLIVGITGCYEGMQVKSDAEEVGMRTTAAVVQGIFLVIVLDAFFAVFFSSIGWN